MTKDLNKQFPGYHVPKAIKSMLDKAKHQVKEKDWDRVYLIDGAEGSGKSLLGLQLGYYLDPNLNLNNIVFNGEDFSDAINRVEKNSCIIFDEAFNGLDSSGATRKMNRFLVRKLQECRQKNLFIIIILPTVFLLNKYVALFRSRCLFHVYALKDGTRGFYRVYNKKNKSYLYFAGKKYYSYQKPFINKSWRFYGKYPLDEQEYRKKKLEALKYEEEQDDTSNPFKLRYVYLCKLLKEKFNYPYTKQAEYLTSVGVKIDNTTIVKYIKRWAVNPIKPQILNN